MIVQRIYLPHWGWSVHIFYDCSTEDVYFVRALLNRYDAPTDIIEQASDNIVNCGLNCGVTWTTALHRTTVMVVGKTTSPMEFWNTFDHEKGHVVEHIADCLHLPVKGEERQYLAGDLAKLTYPIAKSFICAC